MRKTAITLVMATIAAIAAFTLSDHLGQKEERAIFSRAEAIIGRPLTPVSVAGVARRTARRCAVGVYNC